MESTTIYIHKNTRQRLKVRAAQAGLTYDEYLNQLLDEKERQEADE